MYKITIKPKAKFVVGISVLPRKNTNILNTKLQNYRITSHVPDKTLKGIRRVQLDNRKAFLCTRS